jgi:broad specificity phosphatase PhoE
MPEIQKGVPSSRWRLAKSSSEDCVLLAHALPKALAPVVYHSDMPKAAETALVIAMRRGLRTARDGRLSEVDQSASGWLEDYDAAAMRYLETGESPGWEPREAVALRIGEAIDDALALHPEDGDVVFVGHGLAPTLWLHARKRFGDIAAFWRALTLPDAWRLDLETGELERVAGRLPSP